MKHEWKKPVPCDPAPRLQKTCSKCGLQVSFTLAGDAVTNRAVFIDGQWNFSIKKDPECVRHAPRSPKVKREFTEAQRFTFQAPIRKSES